MWLKRIFFILVICLLMISCNQDRSAASDRKDDEKTETTEKTPDSTNSNKQNGKSNAIEFPNTAPPNESNDHPNENNNTAVDEDIIEIERYKQVKNLLVFDTKDTMKLDTTYVATLALGKNISVDELVEKIKRITQPGGKIKITDTTMEIGVQMKATLNDKAPANDPDFSIKSVGTGSNIRTYDLKKNKMVWQWMVTPLKEGYHDLALSISMIDKKGVESDPETKWYSITIFSEKRKETSGGFGAFLGKNWQWMISAIIVPISIAWFTTRQRRKNELAKRAEEKTGNNN